MQISEEGMALLTELEGCSAVPYTDVAGIVTIGIGHALTKSELTSGKLELDTGIISYRHGLTDFHIQQLLREDLALTAAAVNDACTVPLQQHQFDALVSFAFNIGHHAFEASTLLKRLNMGLYSDVPTQIRRWVHAGGRVIEGLKRRREREVALWEGRASEAFEVG